MSGYGKVGQVRHLVRAHFCIVDLVASPFGVGAHGPGAGALVEALVDLLGGEGQSSQSAAERLRWCEHAGVV